jgi:protease I
VAFSKPHHARHKRIDLAHVGESGEIAVLAADGFAASDLTLTAGAAEREGYRTTLLSPNKSLVSGRSEMNEEMNFVVDGHPGEVSAERFSGLLIPGGKVSLDRLADDQDTRLLVQDFLKSGKPVCVFAEAVAFIADAAGKNGIEAPAALVLRGDIFASDGENARDDTAQTFIKALSVISEAA